MYALMSEKSQLLTDLSDVHLKDYQCSIQDKLYYWIITIAIYLICVLEQAINGPLMSCTTDLVNMICDWNSHPMHNFTYLYFIYLVISHRYTCTFVHLIGHIKKHSESCVIHWISIVWFKLFNDNIHSTAFSLIACIFEFITSASLSSCCV